MCDLFSLGTALLVPYLKGLTFLTGALNNNSFPKPLPSREESECLARMAEGDENARDKLVLHNLRLVAHICKKYNNHNQEENEELISIGTIGLIKAINTFKVEKQVKLSTYVSRCVENEILMHYRDKKKESRVVSFDEPVGVDKDGNVMTYLEVLGTDSEEITEMVEKAFERSELRKKVQTVLNDKEKYIMVLRYGLHGGKPWTQQEVADKMGISRSYVSRIEKRAVQKLIKELGAGKGI
ncbi:RNA polymerase sporulation sigma factor SigK [Heliobacterium chlorum]|uniref:RNA polymerase sporulation sigma factor SigK n=1 Tax=Heliobacterium chlorum TaxID=2698 RepID=UPI00311A97AE